MKSKTIIVSSLITLSLLTPSVSFATTLTQSQVNAIIGLLTAFGVNQSVLNSVYADLVPPSTPAPNMTPSATVPPVAQTTPNSSSISSNNGSVSISQLSANPLNYLGNSVIVTGMENGFLPRGGAGGSTNYIQLENPFDLSQPEIEAEIDNPSSYTAAVSALQDPSSPILSFVRVYGIVTPSRAFTRTSLFGNTTIMIPIVNVTRIDQCLHGSMNTVIVDSNFADNFNCTSWSTIVPPSTIGTVAPNTPAPSITAPTTTLSYVTPPAQTITKANQTITSLRGIHDVTYGIVGFTVDANASSGLDISFTVQGNCTVVSVGSGTASVYITGIGSCTVTAHQAGNANYNPAPDVSQTFTINPAPGASPTLSADATLKSLTVNGTSVAGFSANTYTYAVMLPAGSLQAPTVAATTNDPTATAMVTQAVNSLGTATAEVIAQNGSISVYTLNFKPSDAGQCNFNGNIFYCESNPGITVSPITLPAAIVGTSYSEPITTNDPDTSSQSFRWNGIAGTFPPGLGFVFSPTMAFECSGTYCYFAAPPSGVSVPANSAGAFFGTPTTAGTYSFTLQAIDNMNYVALPTFTLTVASSTQ